MSKKKWVRPELIILVRGSPEEAVLNACKTSASSGGPDGPACQGSLEQFCSSRGS